MDETRKKEGFAPNSTPVKKKKKKKEKDRGSIISQVKRGGAKKQGVSNPAKKIGCENLLSKRRGETLCWYKTKMSLQKTGEQGD